MNKPLAIVLVNYFNDAEVMSFISTQLLTQSFQEFDIYVLNNGSENANALEDFCKTMDRLHYMDAKKNLGYIGGFLFVFENIGEQLPRLVILSNSDIKIADPGFMKKISEINIDEATVMVGPSVISSRTGHNQNPFYEKRISLKKLRLLSMVFSTYPSYFIYQVLGILKGFAKTSGKNNHAESHHVYAIHGSFMIFRSAFINKYFSELKDAPYLFGEEIQFAEVAYKHKLKTLFEPSISLTHHEHATTKVFKSAKMLRYLKDSIDFRLKKRSEEQNG